MGNKSSKKVDLGKSIFDFSVDQISDSEKISIETFKGKKAYLIVNVASKWGLTNQNYAELQQLYEKLNADLEILAFPCNNFGSQEPGTNEVILQFAKSKGATFPILGKLECENGASTHPLFQFLRESIPNGILGQGLKWNFTKFLCDKDGVPVKRYGPVDSPLSFEKAIIALIDKEKETPN